MHLKSFKIHSMETLHSYSEKKIDNTTICPQLIKEEFLSLLLILISIKTLFCPKNFDILSWLDDNIPRHNTFEVVVSFEKSLFFSVDGKTFKIINLFWRRVFPLSIKKNNSTKWYHFSTFGNFTPYILFTLAYSFMSLCVKNKI